MIVVICFKSGLQGFQFTDAFHRWSRRRVSGVSRDSEKLVLVEEGHT